MSEKTNAIIRSYGRSAVYAAGAIGICGLTKIEAKFAKNDVHKAINRIRQYKAEKRPLAVAGNVFALVELGIITPITIMANAGLLGACLDRLSDECDLRESLREKTDIDEDADEIEEV